MARRYIFLRRPHPEQFASTFKALDAARSEEDSSGSDDDRSSGGGRRKPPKEISLTDPQAAWVTRKSTDPFFAYDANYLIDNKAGIIVDAALLTQLAQANCDLIERELRSSL